MACSREGQESRNCVYPGDDGRVKYCVLCNTTAYSIDWFVGFPDMPAADEIDLLARQRANMPCFPIDADWIERNKGSFPRPIGTKRGYIHGLENGNLGDKICVLVWFRKTAIAIRCDV